MPVQVPSAANMASALATALTLVVGSADELNEDKSTSKDPHSVCMVTPMELSLRALSPEPNATKTYEFSPVLWGGLASTSKRTNQQDTRRGQQKTV